MTRACVDCRWCDWPAFATGDPGVIEIAARWSHPNAKATTSVVTGLGGLRSRPCTLMRNSPVVCGAEAVCGPHGALWEPTGGKAVSP